MYSPFHLNQETIRDDLTKERPTWILSCYGPGRNAPLQLFGGYPREQSFEELRLRYYEFVSQGNPQLAVSEENELVANAQQQMQTALNDLHGAINYIVAGEAQYPNRNHIIESKGALAGDQIFTNAGKPLAPNSNSMLRTPIPVNTAFGVLTPVGQQTANPFGQTATSGQSTLSPFQKASNPVSRQSTAPNPFSANPIIQPNVPPINPFAARPSTIPQPSMFTQKTFDSAPIPQGPSSQGTFGVLTAPQTLASNQPFQQKPNPFAQAHKATPSSNPFARTQQATQPTQPPQPSGHITSTPANTRKDAQGKLVLWKGMPVEYVDSEPYFRRPDRQLEKIWFPDMVPSWKNETQVPEGWWTEEVREQYAYAMEHGAWKDGNIPEVMPMKEWNRWDI